MPTGCYAPLAAYGHLKRLLLLLLVAKRKRKLVGPADVIVEARSLEVNTEAVFSDSHYSLH